MSPAASVEACNILLFIHLNADVAIPSATPRTTPHILSITCYWKHFLLLWKTKSQLCNRFRKYEGCFHWHCNGISQYITMLIVTSWQRWIHIVVNKNDLKSTDHAYCWVFLCLIRLYGVSTYQSKTKKLIYIFPLDFL